MCRCLSDTLQPLTNLHLISLCHFLFPNHITQQLFRHNLKNLQLNFDLKSITYDFTWT